MGYYEMEDCPLSEERVINVAWELKRLQRQNTNLEQGIGAVVDSMREVGYNTFADTLQAVVQLCKEAKGDITIPKGQTRTEGSQS